MKKCMRLVLLLIASLKGYASQQAVTQADSSYSHGQIAFPVDRMTNLVICNDVTETISKFEFPWKEEKWLTTHVAVIFDLLSTLVDNECPILCPKSLFLTIQMLHRSWQFFLDQSPDSIFAEFKKDLTIKKLKQFVTMAPEQRGKFFYQPISLYKNEITQLTTLYHEINKQHALGNTLEVKSLLKKLKEFMEDEEGSVSLDHLFCMYICFEIICSYDYVCKEVNSDFILFIPKKLIHQSGNSLIQDLKLGLSYSNLSDYDYKHVPSPDIRKDIVTDADAMDRTDSLGSSLLEALTILVMTKYDVLERIPTLGNNVDRALGLLPFFNVFLSGHGNPKQVIAEISIQKEQDEQFSDFDKLLRFLNYQMKTKSLTISSCYPGGKKTLDAFNVKSAFDSSILDSIMYPVINIGTLMTPTTLDPVFRKKFVEPEFDDFYSKQKSLGSASFTLNVMSQYFNMFSIDVFSRYFKLLNAVPSQYEEAFKYISGFYPENESFDLKNYISVKLPNVSWYSPYEFKKHTATISQIQALTQERIIFTDVITEEEFLQVVLLGANVVPGEIIFKNFKHGFPMFLPTNYHNQNYVIQKISVPDLQNTHTKSFSVYPYLKNLLPVSRVKEPINVVVKDLVLGDLHFKNVCTFMQQVFPGSSQKKSGFIFTDPQGATWIISWLSYKKHPSDKKASPRLFDNAQALQLIATVEEQARKALEQFPGLEDDSFQKLEQVMKNTEKGLMPEEVRKSHEIQDRTDMLSRVFDVVHMLVQQEQKEENNKISRVVDVVHFLNIDRV